MSILFTNGAITTMDPTQPTAEAVVVDGDRIVFVGDSNDAPSTDTVFDLAGGQLLPGFVDAHNHLASFALTKLGVNLGGIQGKDAILTAVRDYVRSQPADAPLRGYGWFPDQFESKSPRREWLDEITGDRPMTIMSGDSHDGWFNSAALAAAGIDADTPDPEPGAQYYRRDPDGTPTGHAVEGAASIPVLVATGLFAPEGLREAQALTIDAAPSWGITTYMEAGIVLGPTSDAAEPAYQMLIERDARGELPLRVVGTVWTRSPLDDPQRIADTLVDWNSRLRSEHVSVAVCKLWSDGGLMSGTALLLDDYSDRPGFRGGMTFPPEAIEAQIEAVQRAGFDMHIHVDADGSARTVLDAFERVQSRLGNGDRRHCIAHNSLVHPDDIGRYAQLGVLANCTPLWGTDYQGVFLESYRRLIGDERIEERLFPYGDLVRSGATVTFGADIPGVDIPEIPPLIQIEAAVTRRYPGDPTARAMAPRQAMTVEQALRAYTINGAYQLRMEDSIGSLTVGKKADLVVLESSLFDVEPRQIHEVGINLTMMDGQVTYRR